MGLITSSMMDSFWRIGLKGQGCPLSHNTNNFQEEPGGRSRQVWGACGFRPFAFGVVFMASWITDLQLRIDREIDRWTREASAVLWEFC